ncbi:MAG: CapA family protein [Bacteroidales bacterium]|nr:CapA family protein [Bacteroidales bacterium]
MIRRWSAFILSLLLASPAAFSQLPQPEIPDFAVPMNLKWMGPSDTLEVFVVGDIMSHGKVMRSADEHGYSSFFKHIEDKIAGADLAIGNMEFPLAGKPYSGYPSFSGPSSFPKYLSEVGFDVLLTANNHIFDKGGDGASRTIRRLKEMDILFTGISSDAADDSLRNPLLVPSRGICVAIVNFTYGTGGGGGRWPKVNYMNKDRLKPILQKARRKADIVLVFPHWGNEYEHFHSPAQEDFARFLVENGADAVIGGHPHVIQDIQYIDGVPVVYSLGNAISNQNDLPARLEAALTLRFVHRFGEPLRLLPLHFDYLWCTKAGMIEDGCAAVPVDTPDSLWRDTVDYGKMISTLSSLRKKGLILED